MAQDRGIHVRFASDGNGERLSGGGMDRAGSAPRRSTPTSFVRHTDPATTAAFDAYVAALDRGASILVRPQAAFDGLDRVIDAVGGLATGPLLVTDLESSVSTFRPPEPAGSGGPVLAYHTSGSTGSPKCVVYQHEQVHSHAQAVIDAVRLDEEFAWVALPPARFAYGLSIVTTHHLAGIPVTFTPSTWGLPGLTRVAAQDGRPLAVYALPQHTPLLLASEITPERLGRLIVAGGRLSGTALAALARRFPAMRLTNMYGQAEMGPRLAVWEGSPSEFTEGLIGRPIAGVSLDVADVDLTEETRSDTVHPNAGAVAAGELLARSDHAMSWWLRAPYDRLEEFSGRAEPQRTGDLGVRLPSGALSHQGRADHIVNVAGTKVDVRRIVAIVQEVAHPLLVGVGSRPTRVGGDEVPIIEIVPDGPAPCETAPIRRALHAEFGSLAALFTLTYVDRLTVKESGK